MDIVFLWAALPLVLTLVFFYVASRYTYVSGQPFAFDIEGLIRYGLATIASLVVWLIYAFAT